MVAVIVLLIGFAARARVLRSGNLGFDGGLAVALAASPLRDLLDLSARDVHPPLYYLGLAIWWRVAGPGIAPALWPSLALGTLSIAAGWRLGARAVDPAAAAAIAALVALGPLHVYDGMAARDFAVVVPVSLLSTALLLEWHRDRDVRRRAWRHLVVLGGLYAVGLLSSYYVVLTVIAHGAFVVWRRAPARQWLAAALPGTLALLGWAALSLTRIGPAIAAGARPTAVEAPPLPELLSSLLQSMVGGTAGAAIGPVAAVWAIAAAWGAIVTFGLGRRWRAAAPAGERDAWLLALLGFEAGLIGTAVAVELWLRDQAPARYALVVFPFAAALTGLGLRAIVRASRRLAPVYVGLVVLPLAAGIWLGRHPPELPKPLWDPTGLVRQLAESTRDGDGVAFISLEQAGYYAALAARPRPWEVIPVGPRYLEGDLPVEAARKLDRLLDRADRVILVLYQDGIAPQHRVLRARLAARAFPSHEQRLADSVLITYVAATGSVTLDGPFGQLGPTTLRRVELAGQPRAGQPLGITLEWQADGPTAKPFSVFVHILDRQGEKIAQHDGEPADGTRPTQTWRAGEVIRDRHGFTLPANARGPFTAMIGLYADGARLTDRTGADAIRLPLGG